MIERLKDMLFPHLVMETAPGDEARTNKHKPWSSIAASIQSLIKLAKALPERLHPEVAEVLWLCSAQWPKAFRPWEYPWNDPSEWEEDRLINYFWIQRTYSNDLLQYIKWLWRGSTLKIIKLHKMAFAHVGIEHWNALWPHPTTTGSTGYPSDPVSWGKCQLLLRSASSPIIGTCGNAP